MASQTQDTELWKKKKWFIHTPSKQNFKWLEDKYICTLYQLYSLFTELCISFHKAFSIFHVKQKRHQKQVESYKFTDSPTSTATDLGPS